MSSARKWFANRANARKSTGPKTADGKARSSRNAWRHGFGRKGWGDLRDGAWARDVNALAHIIAGDDANAAGLERAFAVAAAQHDLVLVRRARRTLEQEAGYVRGGCEPAECIAQTFIDPTLLARIARLDRYERRALTRRLRAIAAFYAPAAPEDLAGDAAERSQRVKSQ
jgi:hypothetical protein